MYPQQPQQPQTPGYGAPQPPSQQPGQYPGYTPGYPPPTPGYGQPVQPGAPGYPGAPTPGYGTPSQYPGQYPPGYAAPSQPMAPGYAPGYPGAQTPGYAAPTPTRRRNPILLISIIGGVVVLALIIGLVVRYNGPTSVSRSFLQNLYNFDSAAALQQTCTSSDATKLRQGISAIGALNTTGQQFNSDISQLTLSISSESLSSATVAVSGNVVLRSDGRSSSPSPVSTTLTLDASGLWWCVASASSSNSSGV